MPGPALRIAVVVKTGPNRGGRPGTKEVWEKVGEEYFDVVELEVKSSRRVVRFLNG